MFFIGSTLIAQSCLATAKTENNKNIVTATTTTPIPKKRNTRVITFFNVRQYFMFLLFTQLYLLSLTWLATNFYVLLNHRLFYSVVRNWLVARHSHLFYYAMIVQIDQYVCQQRL